MIASGPESSPQDAVAKKGTWQRERVCSCAEIGRVLERVYFALVGNRYSEQEIFRICLALEEAVVNAVKHGHQDCPGQHVSIRFQVAPDRVLFIVKDRGKGFDPGAVPNPCAPENLERPGGRGLFLMRSYMTWVRHNTRGNCVAMLKDREELPALPPTLAWRNVESLLAGHRTPVARGGAGPTSYVA